MSHSSLPLIIRSDDAGSFLAANEAIEQCLATGLVKNVSVMVPGPAFEDAAKRLAGRDDICLGLHITLNAEFVSTKWGPVAPREQVQSLVDGRGYFHPTPNHTLEAGINVDEAMVEIEAQLARARAAGLKLSYIDEHMGVGRIGLRQRIHELCLREGLLDVHGVPGLQLGRSLEDARRALATARLEPSRAPAAPGTPAPVLWITHPLLPGEGVLELDGQAGAWAQDFASLRPAEYQMLTEPGLQELLGQYKVRAVRYNEVL